MREALADFLLRRVLPMFGGEQDRRRHPWWWPSGVGAEESDWLGGLADRAVCDATGLYRGGVLGSLRLGSAKTRKAVSIEPFFGFEGFWGSGPTSSRRLVVLTDQPNDGGYPQGIHASLMRRLGLLGLKGAHVTNFNKRRVGTVVDGEDSSFHLSILSEELSIVGAGAERLVVCPNISWARADDEVLASLQVSLSNALPAVEVVVLRAASARSPCEPPRALYGQWVKDSDEPEVLASWRRVIDACL